MIYLHYPGSANYLSVPNDPFEYEEFAVMRSRVIGMTVAMATCLVACGGSASDDLRAEAVENYADLVHESYRRRR